MLLFYIIFPVSYYALASSKDKKSLLLLPLITKRFLQHLRLIAIYAKNRASFFLQVS